MTNQACMTYGVPDPLGLSSRRSQTLMEPVLRRDATGRLACTVAVVFAAPSDLSANRRTGIEEPNQPK